MTNGKAIHNLVWWCYEMDTVHPVLVNLLLGKFCCFRTLVLSLPAIDWDCLASLGLVLKPFNSPV